MLVGSQRCFFGELAPAAEPSFFGRSNSLLALLQLLLACSRKTFCDLQRNNPTGAPDGEPPQHAEARCTIRAKQDSANVAGYWSDQIFMSWPRWDTENNFCLEKPLFSHSLIYVLIESAFSKVNSDYSSLVRRSLRRHEQWKFFLVRHDVWLLGQTLLILTLFWSFLHKNFRGT
ncbi:hypothetical protein PAPYR_573 [Paratrimastix pyriformis]|uniref:Uncharacterized protein n=1 Tax=Paratrimastix pyriformis TaxID=342808 RepID=A0ABQ8UYX7_9EUKA|nr:hypothetical protein PAPYR_573 [Paratrimastix pyriformis]